MALLRADGRDLPERLRAAQAWRLALALPGIDCAVYQRSWRAQAAPAAAEILPGASSSAMVSAVVVIVQRSAQPDVAELVSVLRCRRWVHPAGAHVTVRRTPDANRRLCIPVMHN